MSHLSSASIQVFASDLARTTAFYRLPPYDAPWGQRYATLADPDGI